MIDGVDFAEAGDHVVDEVFGQLEFGGVGWCQFVGGYARHGFNDSNFVAVVKLLQN